MQESIAQPSLLSSFLNASASYGLDTRSQVLGHRGCDRNAPLPAPTEGETGDAVDVSNQAVVANGIGALLEQLNNAATPKDAVALLGSLKDYIVTNTGATFTASALDSIVTFVEQQIENLGSGENFSLQLSVGYSEQTISSDGFYQSAKEFSVNFRFMSDDTMMQAKLNFGEMQMQTSYSTSYQSFESAKVQLISFDANLAESNAGKLFSDLADTLLGMVGEALGTEKQQNTLLPGMYTLKAQAMTLRMETLQTAETKVDSMVSMLEKLREMFTEGSGRRGRRKHGMDHGLLSPLALQHKLHNAFKPAKEPKHSVHA